MFYFKNLKSNRKIFRSHYLFWCYFRNYRICIVGAGPSAFYVAQHLIKNKPDINIDILEKLSLPYGLLRYGVAPDHLSIKKMMQKFNNLLKSNELKIYENINVGKDISLKNILMNYDAVILAYGAFNDQRLNIKGEDSQGVYSAQQIVGWYNSHPNFVSLVPKIGKTVLIIGVGNVSLDIARIFLEPKQYLEDTSISKSVLLFIDSNRPSKIIITGRKGPLQSTFTTKELRQLSVLPNCKIHFDRKDFQNTDNVELPRAKSRLRDLMVKILGEVSGNETIYVKYHMKPIAIINNLENHVTGVLYKDNLENEQIIPCDTVIKSIGFHGHNIDDDVLLVNNSKISNERGKVIGFENLYCSGWIKYGAVGDLTTTMYDAYETADTIINNLGKQKEKPCFDLISYLQNSKKRFN